MKYPICRFGWGGNLVSDDIPPIHPLWKSQSRRRSRRDHALRGEEAGETEHMPQPASCGLWLVPWLLNPITITQAGVVKRTFPAPEPVRYLRCSITPGEAGGASQDVKLGTLFRQRGSRLLLDWNSGGYLFIRLFVYSFIAGSGGAVIHTRLGG